MKTRWIILCLVYITFSCNDHEVNVKSMEHANDFWLWAQAGEQRSGDWLMRTAGMDVVVDSFGNAYVVGFTCGEALFAGDPVISNAVCDLYVAQFKPNGTIGWIRQVGDEGDFGARRIYLGNDGILYIVGSIYPGKNKPAKARIENYELYLESGRDIILMALDFEGNILWAKQAGIEIGEYSSYTMGIDSESNIYVALTLEGRFGDTDIVSEDGRELVLAKYDRSGNFQWVVKSGFEEELTASAMAVDKSGNVYVGGSILSRVARDENGVWLERKINFYINKYDRSGNLIWSKTGGDEVDRAHTGSIAVDDEGYIIATGHFWGELVIGDTTLRTEFDVQSGRYFRPQAFFIKLDNNGSPIWANQFYLEGATSGGECVAIDIEGNSYYTGDFFGRVFIAKFDTEGNLKWVKKSNGKRVDHMFGFPAGASGSSIALNHKGDAYITGTFEEEAGFGAIRLKGQLQNMFIAKFNPNPEIDEPSAQDDK